MDWNGEDGAINVDMRKPIPVGALPYSSYDVVTNFGFTEHVADQEQCFANINDLVSVDGWFCFCTPAPHNSWQRHGYWQPSVEWYKNWAVVNGYHIHMCREYTERHRPTVIGRFRKLQQQRHRMPEEGYVRRTKVKFTERDLA